MILKYAPIHLKIITVPFAVNFHMKSREVQRFYIGQKSNSFTKTYLRKLLKYRVKKMKINQTVRTDYQCFLLPPKKNLRVFT